MVLLHGFSSSGRSWSRVARAFTEKYHVLALDHRGHGESDWDPESSYLLATFVGDLERFVEQLGLAPFTLMGHSMGGAVSLRYRRAASPRR